MHIGIVCVTVNCISLVSKCLPWYWRIAAAVMESDDPPHPSNFNATGQAWAGQHAEQRQTSERSDRRTNRQRQIAVCWSSARMETDLSIWERKNRERSKINGWFGPRMSTGGTMFRIIWAEKLHIHSFFWDNLGLFLMNHFQASVYKKKKSWYTVVQRQVKPNKNVKTGDFKIKQNIKTGFMAFFCFMFAETFTKNWLSNLEYTFLF